MTQDSLTREEFRALPRHAGLTLSDVEMEDAYLAYCEFFVADILPRVRRAAEQAS